MRKTRIMALLLSALMVTGLFAGCGKKAPNYATIDGEETDGALFEAYTRSKLSAYTSQGIDASQIREQLKQEIDEDGKTYGDMIKEDALNYLKMFAAIEKLAKENDISLTSEEKDTIKEQKEEQITQMGGRSVFVDSLKQQYLTEEMYDHMMEVSALQQKVMSALFNQGGKYALSEDEVVSKVVDGNVRVRHIVITGSESDEDFAEKQKKANDTLARIQAGEDFETVLAEVGEDPGMTNYPNGYVFNESGVLVDNPSTTLDPTFTAESFKLGVNQVSGVILSTSGLHIIKRLPLDETFVKENISTYYPAFAYEAYQAKFDEVMNALDVQTTEAYDNINLDNFIDTASSSATSSTAGSTPNTATAG